MKRWERARGRGTDDPVWSCMLGPGAEIIASRILLHLTSDKQLH